jgi:GDP-mannose 6-dehydrogenase
MKICVHGQGYVGAVTAACLAESGHDVVAVDADERRVGDLQRGVAPVLEPGLAAIVCAAVASGRLRATTDSQAAIAQCEISLVCVGTPDDGEGAIDLSQLHTVCCAIGHALARSRSYHLVVIRSTVVPGTTRGLALPLIGRLSGGEPGRDFGICVNPEFLREADAIADFRRPPKTVVGEMTARDGDMLLELYSRNAEVPVIRTSLEAAEMLKYVDNAWHALKVAFGNEIGAMSKAFGVDGRAVMQHFVRDTALNISAAYLRPGAPFGGRCLSKDISAIRTLARSRDIDVALLDAIDGSNNAHFERVATLVAAGAPRTIGIVGMGFKPGIDDSGAGVSRRLAATLVRRGYNVSSYDRHLAVAIGTTVNLAQVAPNTGIQVRSLRELVAGADTIVLCHDDDAYLEELRSIVRPSQRVVDLVGVGAAACGATDYVGIAW